MSFCQIPAATLTVTSTNDSGAGTLRQALLDAAATNGADTVVFNLSGTAPFTINLLSTLSLLNEVTLDGSTQPGYANQPLVELNGTSAGASTFGLRLGTSNVVRALAINRFGADGIRCDGSGNVVVGCRIGTDVTGNLARGNGMEGVFINGTANNRIGGTNAADRNIIAANNDAGVYLLNAPASGNVILGNYIGAGGYGTNDLGNVNNGIALYNAPNNTLGGLTSGARNIIAGNDGSGISLNGGNSSGNIIQGNYIGVATNGSLAVSNIGDGITLNGAGNNVIGGTNTGAGNLISGNGKAGIYGNAAGTVGNQIQGNYIGTDATGVAAVPNNFAGVSLENVSSNVIGGDVAAARNVISGNRQDGIVVTNSTGNFIQGNYIGVNASGTAALGNQSTGVSLYNSSYNTISGSAVARSLISGNSNIGLFLFGTRSLSNSVRGNFIGVNAAGNAALGNALGGITLSDSPYNQVGGVSAGDRNVISGNGFPSLHGGVELQGVNASSNRFIGNYIGTDVTGMTALQNAAEGIYISAGRGNLIGGNQPGAGNLISSNRLNGITLVNQAMGNIIAGNLIGTKADGVSALGNTWIGIEINENCSSNVVGGLSPGDGNKIAFSGLFISGGRAGVRVRTGSTNNAILGNSIFSNASLGIAFTGFSPTLNDPCDGDTGGNQQQNFPVLTQAVSGSNTGVRGSLDSAANATYRLQFFASPSCDALGNGEGQIYLGDKLITAGGNCSNSFVATLPVAVPVGYVITATATDPTNNTSEFSLCQTVAATPELAYATPA
ncbi:MAG: hypothetical protein EPO07_10900, partial [Verrucomicrobia bacterium]